MLRPSVGSGLIISWAGMRGIVSLAAAMALPGSGATIGLVFPSQVPNGNTFDVGVQLSGIFDGRPTDTLIAFGFNFNYDPTALSLISGGADATNGFDASNLQADPPQIIGISFGGFTSGTPEPLLLATLTLQALKPGPANFSLTSDPLDLNTGIVFDNLPFGEINVNGSVNVVPEPDAVWLIALGLVALCAGRARLMTK